MLTLNRPQYTFLKQLNTKYRAFVGGFGSSKTFSGCLDLLLFASQNPKTRQGYFAPTYTDIRDTFYPTIAEAAELLDFWVDIKTCNKEVHIYRGRVYYGTIICRSMDNPGSIVGFKIARALVDEIDILKPEKADMAWNKIVARLRLKIPGVENGIGVTTTPEGFKFVYNKFKNNPTESYSMVQASTYENADNLPSDYISSLKETYPAQLVEAYINGEFVNLTSGSVYPDFCRTLNNTDMTVQKFDERFRKKAALHIGMDFNIGKMSATVDIIDGNKTYQVDEFMGLRDTPAMISTIKSRYKDRIIMVYPDASGGSADTRSAGETDISLLEAAGFIVIADDANPRIKDRVNSINSMICNSLGDRRMFINATLCPVSTDALEQQVWGKDGKPDKDHDKDHPNDAKGYMIWQRFPISGGYTQIARIG